MAFQIPTLKDLAQRTSNAFRANLKGSDARLWPNNVAVSAKVMAGAVWEAFSFLDYISRQILVHTATDGIWIERHALEYGMARLPASFAEGQAVLTGDVGIAVPAGLILQRADGTQYQITQGATTNGVGEVTVGVKALVVGKIGNAAPGVALTLTTPLERMNSEGDVAPSGIGAGADVESDESLRQRVLFRKRNPPHGGSMHDYVIWAREMPGVTRVFIDPVTATNGRNTVGLWFLMDDTYTNGIPQLADLEVMRQLIELFRPAGAVIGIAAPVAVPVNITVDDLSPDTDAVRDAIRLELKQLFRRSMRVSTLTEPFTLYKSLIDEAVSVAVGEHHHTLNLPAGNTTYTVGQLPVLGTVAFD